MGAREGEVLSMALADLDSDGLEDALVARGEGQVVFLRRLDQTGDHWESRSIQVRGDVGNPRAVAVGDLDRDGAQDIALTTYNSAGKQAVVWLSYENTPLDDQWRVHAVSGADAGQKYDRLELIDLDQDGDLDLLTCEEGKSGRGIGVLWYENPCVCPGR